MKLLIFFITWVLLTSCMSVNNNYPVTYIDNTTIVQTVTSSEAITACSEFVLPKPKPLPPRPTTEQINSAVTDHDLDLLIIAYVNALKRHASTERSDIEAVYTQWSKQCNTSQSNPVDTNIK